jgi:hypothetical protein
MLAAMRGRVTAGSVLVAAIWCLLPLTPGHADAPWAVAIVATDPLTHQVGAAGAECAPEDAAAMATIVPGRGAAVTFPTNVRTSNGLLYALRHGPASAVVAGARDTPEARQDRVFAAATIGKEGAAAVGSHVENGGEWVGLDAAIVTVGVAPGVLTQGAGALQAKGSLAQRLVASLEATAGAHDCHGHPSAAFVVVAGQHASPLVPARGLEAARNRQRSVLAHQGGTLAADELEDALLEAGAIPRPKGPHAPEVYFSLLQGPAGFGAVDLLQQAYDATHPQATASASLAPTLTPTSTPASVAPGDGGHARKSVGYLVVAVLLVAAVVALLLIARRLGRLDKEGPREG